VVERHTWTRSIGVRYINTGSWTETPVHYIDVTDAGLDLKNWNALAGAGTAGEE